jgi:soluble lytic murein transglycosylase-like protein
MTGSSASNVKWAGCLAVLVCLSVAKSGCADIFTYTDDSGEVHLSNHAVDGREVLLLQEPKPVVAAPVSSTTTSAVLAAMPYAKLVDAAARKQHLDRALIHAVIATESAYNPKAISPRGARGLMQLMPATARRYGVSDVLDPNQNIQGGSRYLKDLLALFGNDLKLSLAAYNAGENAVVNHGNQIPPYRETQAYVAHVMERYRVLSKQ